MRCNRMNTRREFFSRMTSFGVAGARVLAAQDTRLAGLDPRGKLHMPIGIPNSLDTLKTFVEAEGNFSPGFGTYGIYFWLFDRDAKTLHAPTLDGTPCDHGLEPAGLPIPYSAWNAGSAEIR